MTGGVMMTSDKLDELSPNRIDLFREFLQKQKMVCDFPLLGKTYEFSETGHDPIIVQRQHPISNPNQDNLLFIFNTGEERVKRIFDLDKLKVPTTLKLMNWLTDEINHVRDNELSIELKPHDGVLYFISS
jgi:hypothetical protein